MRLKAKAAPMLQSIGPGQALPALVITMEVLATFPWLIWLSRWSDIGWGAPPLNLLGAMMLALGAGLLSNQAIRRSWPLARVRMFVLPPLLLLLGLVVRIENGGGYAIWDTGWLDFASKHISLLVAGLVYGGFLLWRGISAGRGELISPDVYPRFIVGLLSLVGVLLIWKTVSGSGSFPSLYVVGFFCFALLAITAAHLQEVKEQLIRSKESAAMLSRRWLWLSLIVVLGIIGLSVGLGSLFSPELVANVIVRPLSVAMNWLLSALIFVMAYTIGWLVAALIYVIRFLISIFQASQPQKFTPPDVGQMQNAVQGKETTLSAWVAELLKWGLIAIVVGVAIFILAMALSRYRKNLSRAGFDEVGESLWSYQKFKNDIKLLISALFGIFRRRGKLAGTALVAVPAASEDQESRLFTVREMYQGLLWEGRRAELPRRPSQTPFEYADKLEPHAEPAQKELREITDAYVAERYGGEETPPERVRSLNGLWLRLRSVLHKPGTDEKKK
jgi:hypothetical protein